MDHDGGYHLLFSHPRMVADLLAGFIDEPWVAELDLASLERVNAKFHADGLEPRDGDVIWRLKRRDGTEAFLYLAIEFQSTIDRWMALRVAVYVLLLYLHLIREAKLDPDGLLPPVYPIVLFNGNAAWTARVDLRDLIAPGPDGRPWPWRPRFRYHILDEQRYDPGRLQGLDNIVAVLFQMEQCRTVQELRTLVDRAVALLPDEENATLRRAFATMLKVVLAPARGIDLGTRDVGDLLEVRDMLADRVTEWEQEWLQQGLQRGLQQGLQQGRTEGEAKALIRLIERRFGPVGAGLRDRILSAGSSQIEDWLDRVIDAPTLDSVFPENPFKG